MAINDQEQELPEVQVESRNRFPTAGKRVSRATSTLAPGTFLPRVQALLNPRLFRERGDTDALMESAFADDGPLASLAATNPDLATALRQQAESPMSSQQHEQFRSAILGLIGDQVEREEKTRTTIADNASFMEAFAAMDAALPGIKDPSRFTYEEAERKQIALLYKQAQQTALVDPEASKGIMADVRKRADALTANVRAQMEQVRKAARIEDSSLWSGKQEKLNETQDVIDLLRHDTEQRGKFRPPNEALINRAMALLGSARGLPDAGFSQAAAQVGAGASQLAGGGTKGIIIDAVTGVAGMVADKMTESKDVESLIERLQFNAGLIEQGYQVDRARLVDRFKPYGLAFGEQAGEVYAVLDENYKAQAEKLGEPALDAKGNETEKTQTLRTMLDDELAAADASVEQLKPEAAANMPGARAKLAAALERQRTAEDDLAIFEDDLRQERGAELTDSPTLKATDAAAAISQARARRQQRDSRAMQSQVRQGIRDALRSYTR